MFQYRIAKYRDGGKIELAIVSPFWYKSRKEATDYAEKELKKRGVDPMQCQVGAAHGED